MRRGAEPPALSAPDGSRARALDRLAALAALVALVPIPLLTIGSPVTHLLVFTVVVVFGWLLIRPDRSVASGIRALDLGWPGARRGWPWIAAAGVVSAVVRWWLDERVLDGRGGIHFYERLLREHGVIGSDDGARWALFAGSAPVLFVVILLDGVFFSGLIQGRIEAHTNRHAAVFAQAVLFALPHTFAGATPDIAYGVGTFVAGIAYGYIYRACRNHWVPASLLWLHVLAVWAILLGNLPGPSR